MIDKISNIYSRQVLDSRGNPTIYTLVKTSKEKGFSLFLQEPAQAQKKLWSKEKTTQIFQW
ncbi:MAG: hypothetical protein CM15mP129_06840 [Chloroflexota bacterium]|nr:MAG: hypothetical protein CM15mP129_06840 [Chloroflexota bacterium]